MLRNIKKKLVIICVFLFITTAIMPVFNGLSIGKTNNKKNFSIIIHKIEQHDIIDPWPHTEGGDWTLNLYVKNFKKTYECEGLEITIDKTFTWQDIIDEDDNYVNIKMELLDKDSGTWPDEDDIADISAYVDEDFQDGDYDNTDDFYAHRPAVFKRQYDLVNNCWMSVNGVNDYLRESDDTVLNWNITSGNYDGSTIVDENDVSIYFMVSEDNTPPYPPEKPSGPVEGWINTPYIFSTKGFDIDDDQIKFGWDWDGDSIIDDFTTFYNSWDTARYTKIFTEPRIYYIRAIAVDIDGFCSEWSEPLKVEINGPYGKSGVEVFEWSLGHVFCHYYNHYETQEIINIMRSGGNIVTALSTLIAAIATACGVPMDYSASFAVATALIRLGLEVINLMDRGMGIYTKIYTIEVGGVIISSFSYAWSQSLGEDVWIPPPDNLAPNKPSKPSGDNEFKINTNHEFSSTTQDPDDDKIRMIFEWNDGNYSISEELESGRTIRYEHSWEKKGLYSVRVKALDEYGQESEWSDPLMINVKKQSKNIDFLFFDFLKISNFLIKILEVNI